MVRFSTRSKDRISTPLLSIGSIIVLLASIFPFNYGTSLEPKVEEVTEEEGLPALTNTNATGNLTNNQTLMTTNATGNITNITGQAVLVTKINLSSVAKSAPYSGEQVKEHEDSPFPFPPSNVTGNVSQLQVPFHSLNSSSLKQPVNQSANNITQPAAIDEPTNQCGGCVPPDVQIAVGDRVPATGFQYAVEMVNLGVQIFGYQFGCTACSNFATTPQTLRTFFGLTATNTDTLFDPRIFYDPNSDRFFAAITDATTSSVRVAVSTSANPLGNWNIFNFPFGTGNCPDQPTIGTASSVFAISVNLYSNNCMRGSATFMGVQFILVNKNDLLTGAATPRSSVVNPPSLNTPSQLFSVRVVKDTWEPLKLVGTEPFNDKSYALIYQYSNYEGGCLEEQGCYRVTCDPSPSGRPLPPTICSKVIDSPNTVVTPAAQPAVGGTTVGLETGDNRIVSASAAGNPRILPGGTGTGGSLWFAYNEECDNSANSCFRLVQLRSETKTIQGTIGTAFPNITRTSYKVNQDFQVTAAPNDAFYPALDVDRDQNMALIFGFSSSSQFPSLAVSRQDYNPGLPPSNSILPPATVVSGTSSDITGSGSCTAACSRYGDYFGAAANPVERNWWLAGEWMTADSSGNAFYSTWIEPFFDRP